MTGRVDSSNDYCKGSNTTPLRSSNSGLDMLSGHRVLVGSSLCVEADLDGLGEAAEYER